MRQLNIYNELHCIDNEMKTALIRTLFKVKYYQKVKIPMVAKSLKFNGLAKSY